MYLSWLEHPIPCLSLLVLGVCLFDAYEIQDTQNPDPVCCVREEEGPISIVSLHSCVQGSRDTLCHMEDDRTRDVYECQGKLRQ